MCFSLVGLPIATPIPVVPGLLFKLTLEEVRGGKESIYGFCVFEADDVFDVHAPTITEFPSKSLGDATTAPLRIVTLKSATDFDGDNCFGSMIVPARLLVNLLGVCGGH